MSITWVPIDQCPEEWKDGRKVLITSSDNPLPIIGHWHNGFFVRSIDGCVFATHVAEIPPELQPENIGLGKRVSVTCTGFLPLKWHLRLPGEWVGQIISGPSGYLLSRKGDPVQVAYPTLQAAIDAFEETLP